MSASFLDTAKYFLPFVSAPAAHDQANPPTSSSSFNHLDEDIPALVWRSYSGFVLQATAMMGLAAKFPPLGVFMAGHKIVTFASCCIPGIIETLRARREVDRLGRAAVQAYTDATTLVPMSVIRQLHSPRAFSHLVASKNPDFRKMDTEGKNLISRLFDASISGIISGLGSTEVRNMLADATPNLLEEVAGEESLLVRALQFPDTLKHILKSRKIVLSDLDKDTQLKLLKNATTPEVLEILCQHGLNVNIQDDEGNTVLVHWAKVPQGSDGLYMGINSSMIIALLNSGADVRLHSKKYSSISEIASGSVKFLFKQAEQNYPPVDLPKETGWMSYLPWKPTPAHKDAYSYVPGRSYRVEAFLALGSLITLSLPMAWFETALVCSAVSSLIFGWVSISRDNKEATRAAVTDFISRAIPSPQAMNKIAHDGNALRLLIDSLPKEHRGLYLNKRDEEGSALLDKVSDFDSFKYLVDNGATLSVPNLIRLGRLGTLGNVRQPTKEIQFIEYLLKNNLFSPKSLTADDTVSLWCQVRSSDVVELLLEHGFDINSQNNNGSTAVMLLAQAQNPDAAIGKINILKAVAKKKLDLTITNNDGKKACDLTSDLRLKALLQ